MAEKLALKTELHRLLHLYTLRIDEMEKVEHLTPRQTTELMCLKQHRDDILHLISICVQRNKY